MLDFLGHNTRFENLGEIFKEIANNPFGLYVIYLEIFLRVCFNELEQITDKIVFNCFSKKKKQS